MNTTIQTKRIASRRMKMLIAPVAILAGSFFGFISPVGAEETDTHRSHIIIEEKKGLDRDGVFDFCKKWGMEETFEMGSDLALCHDGDLFIVCVNFDGWDCELQWNEEKYPAPPTGEPLPAPGQAGEAPATAAPSAALSFGGSQSETIKGPAPTVTTQKAAARLINPSRCPLDDLVIRGTGGEPIVTIGHGCTFPVADEMLRR